MEAIEDPLSECDVLLAIIHPGWIEDDGLTNSEDVLRIEIERALERELLVVEEFEAKSVTGIIDDMAARLATLEEAEFELMLLAR
jgi:hypothetical protein